jgi:hypothetical protein
VAQTWRLVVLAHVVVAAPGVQTSVRQAPPGQAWPLGHAVVVCAAPRASHSTTAVFAALQLSAPGVHTRAVHAAVAPEPVQICEVAAQSVVVRIVPVASHTASTSPAHARLPGVHVRVAHALSATRHVCPLGHAVVAPQLRPSGAHVWKPVAAQRVLPGAQSSGSQRPAVQPQPYAAPAHSGRVVHASNRWLLPSAAHMTRPAPSQRTLDGAHTRSWHTPAPQNWPEGHGVSVRTVPVASHSKAVVSFAQPTSLGAHTTARHEAVPPATTQLVPVAQASVVRIVPSALQRITVAPEHDSVPASHTTSSMGTQAKRAQRNPPSQSAVESHSRGAHAPVAITQYSSAAQAASSRQ